MVIRSVVTRTPASEQTTFACKKGRIDVALPESPIAAAECKDKINNDSVLEILLELRDNARKQKDYKLSDSIRDELAKIGINLNDKD